MMSKRSLSIAAIAVVKRPFELIERRPRLQRRNGVDQIRDRFCLHQIELAD